MQTAKGPKWNESNLRTISGEDHLGVLYVGISIADTLQSGITSITPRARYWSFFAWVLKDFIYNVPDTKSVKNFKVYLKKQEWFFILANIADAVDKNISTNSVIGSTKGQKQWNIDQTHLDVEYNYVQDSYGGYGTYRNVLKIMGVTKAGDADQGVHIDKLTRFGSKLADAFEYEIKDTLYYKEYRKKNGPIPREVLRDYGKVAALSSLTNKSKDHKLLMNMFMPLESKSMRGKWRRDSLLYYMHLINNSSGKKINFDDWQIIMYDSYFHNEIWLPDNIRTVAIGWEIYQARQFFTYSLQTIWSLLLEKMSKKIYSKDELISSVIDDMITDGYDVEKTISSLIEELPLSRETRTIYLKEMKEEQKSGTKHLWQPLRVMLEVYHRMQNRDDFQQLHRELLRLGGKDSISFQAWNEDVAKFKGKSIREFISYILRYLIIDQHQKVALNKMITTKNETYHFVENNGKLYLVAEDNPVFNTFRVIQGLNILDDLGLIIRENRKYSLTSLGDVKLHGKN